jgi:purine-binding chemotaxis protein CheW
VPVFDLRALLREPERPVRPGDHLVIAHTRWRTVALLVDAVAGVVPRVAAQVTPAGEIMPGLAFISGVLRLDGGLVLIHDLERFLSLEETAALERALGATP